MTLRTSCMSLFIALRVLLLGGLLGTVPYVHAHTISLNIPSVLSGVALSALCAKLTTLTMKPKNIEASLIYSGTTIGFMGAGCFFSMGYIAAGSSSYFDEEQSASCSAKQKFHYICACSSALAKSINTNFRHYPLKVLLAEFVLGMGAQKLVEWKLAQEEKDDGPLGDQAPSKEST